MWLFACSFWKVVARCDDAVICPIKKKQIFHMLPRLRSSSLLPAVYCRSPDWSLAAAVHTPADFLSPAELPCSSAALAALNRIFFSGGSFTERTSTYPSLASHFPWEPQHQAAAAGSRAANIVVTDVLGRHTCTWWISTWPSVSRRGINNTANSILHVYYRPACGGRGGFMCRVWYINPD